MNLAERMVEIATKAEVEKNRGLVDKFYPKLLKMIEDKAKMGLLTLSINTDVKEQREILENMESKNKLICKLKNDGFFVSIYEHNDYWNYGKISLTIKWKK